MSIKHVCAACVLVDTKYKIRLLPEMRTETVSSLYFLKTKYLTHIYYLHCKNSYEKNTVFISTQGQQSWEQKHRFTKLKTILTLFVQIL